MPLCDTDKTVLDVGCGKGPVSRKLSIMGYIVDAVDPMYHESWEFDEGVNFINEDFMKSEKIKEEYSVVMCSEVLEHLPNYTEFYKKILETAKDRVIITIPYERSFMEFGPPPKGHCNFWSFDPRQEFKDVKEFYKMSEPYSVSISKIRTKERDVEMGQWCFLIVVDKRQKYG